MKSSNPFVNFIKQLSTKEEKKKIEFKSMKDVFHNPSKQIKSYNLLSYFSPIIKFDSPKNEYSVLLKQQNKNIEKISKQNNESYYKFDSPNKLRQIKEIKKIENIKLPESFESSFTNFNYKVGMNAPLSYNELSSNNISTEINEKQKNDLNKNNKIKNINCNLLNEIHRIESNKNAKIEKKKKFDYNIFINIDEKNLNYSNFNKRNKTPSNNNSMKIKLKSNINNNINTKRVFQPKIYNYSQIYSNRSIFKKEKIKEIDFSLNKKVNNKDKNNYTKNYIISSRKFLINDYNKNDIENMKNLNKNKKNNKIKVLSKNSSSKIFNLGIFEKILIDLKSIKSAVNKNNKKIIFNALNSEKRCELIKNENNKSRIIENGLNLSNMNESKISSGCLSNDLNDINSSGLSTNRIKIQDTYNLVKKSIDKKNTLFKKNYIKINTNLKKVDENNLLSEKSKNKNKRKNNKKDMKEEIYSESNSQNNIFENEEKEEKNDIDKNIMINTMKNYNKKISKNANNNNSLIASFDLRKKYTINNESSKDNPGINIYQRSQIFRAKTDLKTEKLRKKLLDKEDSEMSNAPKINEKSKKLTKNNIPIYERLDDIEKKKQYDIQRIKDLIIRENDIDENTINQKSGKNFDKKHFNKWLRFNNAWIKQKKNKMEKIKDKLNKEELNNESFTFKPKIDIKSEKIFNKNKKLSKSPVVERLFKKALIKNYY